MLVRHIQCGEHIVTLIVRVLIVPATLRDKDIAGREVACVI
jgi:hypothetical protein